MANYKVYIAIGLISFFLVLAYSLSGRITLSRIHSIVFRKKEANADNGLLTGKKNLALSVVRHGRLGNAMWQYSALYGLANLTGRIPILNPGFRDLKKIFNLSTPMENRMERFSSFYRYDSKEMVEPYNLERILSTLRNLSEHVMLSGYFQSFRFFSHVSDQLRNEFVPRSEVKRKVSTFFRRHNLTNRNIVKIGVHIRRGVLTTKSWINKGFGPPEETYFRNAMHYFRSKYSKVHFIVSSDDLEWARGHILDDDVTFVPRQAAGIDMAIMASCDHVIISNGTFSWWVGWLCRGTTVRYKRIPKRNTVLYNMTRGEYWPPDDAYNHYVSVDS